MNVFRRVLGLIWLEANNCFSLLSSMTLPWGYLNTWHFLFGEERISIVGKIIFFLIFFIRVSVVAFLGEDGLHHLPTFISRTETGIGGSWHYNLTKKLKKKKWFVLSFFFFFTFFLIFVLCFIWCFLLLFYVLFYVLCFLLFVLCFRQPSVMYWLNPVIMFTVATRSQFKIYPVVLKYLWNRLLELGR